MQRLKPGGAAALRVHGQDDYCDECIRGERTALPQAVSPNGTEPSSTVSLAVMWHSGGKVSPLLGFADAEPDGTGVVKQGLVANALNDDRSHAVALDPVQKRSEHEAGPLGEGRNGLAL